MEYKYEPIFGDQSLFDGAPEDAVSVRYGKSEYIFDSDEIKATTGQLRDVPVVAMRRIIKEPKRWTWEDKKAGRLPEVGAVVVGGATNCEYEISKITPTHIVLIGTDKFVPLVGYYKHEEFISCNNPLETPAEKAQRLEDEFVVAMLDAANQEQLMSAGFKSGVIAAYRKLKGGE